LTNNKVAIDTQIILIDISSMDGRKIRNRRIVHGLTQVQLAEKVGRSQSTISAIEAGRSEPSPLLKNRLTRVFEHLESEHKNAGQEGMDRRETVFDLPDIQVADQQAQTHLGITRWRRPDESGDHGCVISVSDSAVIVAAIDVAGQGTGAFPAALYLLGWLRGQVASSATTPRLSALAGHFSEELRRVDLEASLYLGLLDFHKGPIPSFTYEGASYGFPPPLLISGPPFRTLESAHVGPSLPSSLGAERVARVESLTGPWRLVIATDGLLRRLGEGKEVEGLRPLRKWQTGPNRDILSSPALRDGPEADDEMLITIQSEVWQEETVFSADDTAERNRLLLQIRQEHEQVASSEETDGFLQAVLEAIENVSDHAYDKKAGGIVRVRRLMDHRYHWVEVEDEGSNRIKPADVRRSNSGFSVMRRFASAVDYRRRPTGGTVVTLVAKHEPTTGGGHIDRFTK